MDNEELYFIIAGCGLMYSDGETFEVGCGDCIINRPGGTHALENIGDTELKMMVIEIACRNELDTEGGQDVCRRVPQGIDETGKLEENS